MLSSAVDFMITSIIQQSKGLSKDSVNILVHRLLIKILEFSVSIKIIPIKCLNGVKSDRRIYIFTAPGLCPIA